MCYSRMVSVDYQRLINEVDVSSHFPNKIISKVRKGEYRNYFLFIGMVLLPIHKGQCIELQMLFKSIDLKNHDFHYCFLI